MEIFCFEAHCEHIFEYNLEMLLGGTQTPKVQKLGVQKRSVFLPVGGGVGQFEKQTQT